MHGEVNMINSNAASDGGKRNCVSGSDDHGHSTTYGFTVCLSALDTGDEWSCAAVGGLRRAYLVEVLHVHSSNGASP